MDDSKLFKLPTHSVNATDLHLWKQYRNCGTFKSGNKRVFRCLMFNRCSCKAGVKIFESATLLELYFLGEHNESSHDEDKSKYLIENLNSLRQSQSLSAAVSLHFAP